MGKLKPKEFLTKERIDEIKKEINELERQIKGGEDNKAVGFMQHATNRIQNPEDIKREINRRKKHISDGTPKPFESTAKANKAYNWAKKAERWIKEHAPQGKDVFIKYPEPGNQEHDFDRSVQQMVDWMKNGEKVLKQYKYIMRRLDPKNPYAGRIEGI